MLSSLNVRVLYQSEKRALNTNFDIYAVLMDRIAVVTPPKKTSYKIGETIDYKGLVVHGIYNNDTTEIITNKCTITPAQGSAFNGEYCADITYNGFSCIVTFSTIPSGSKPPEPPEPFITGLSAEGPQTDIYVGDVVDYSDIHIIADYSDGTQKDVTDDCNFSVPKGSKLKDPKTKLEASLGDLTVPLNEPVLDEIEELDAFIAPKADDNDLSDYPMFSVGSTKMGTLPVRKFLSGTLIPYFITYGRDCDPAYTEDAEGNKIGEWITYNTIPDTKLSVWFIDPKTGKQMGSTWVPFKYSDKIKTVSREPQWRGYSVWGYSMNIYTGERTGKEVISARGPVYLEPAPARSVQSIKPVIKNGKISWDITTSAVYPNEEENEKVIVSVEETDIPEGLENWIRLADSPCKLIDVTGDKAVFEYVSGGTVHRVEIDLSKFTLPPTYNKCTGIYTWANTLTVTRDYMLEKAYTEYLHMIKFGSDYDPDNEYYIAFGAKFKNPLYQTVGLEALYVTNNAAYNAGDRLDYDELNITAVYTNGTTQNIPPGSVTFSLPEGTEIPADIALNLGISYTNENGESVSTECNLKGNKLSRLNVLPPNKTHYDLYERVDYTGFEAYVVYVDGTTKDVTNDVYISAKGTAYITPETERTVTVTYREAGETVTATFEIDINSSGIWVAQQPDKRVYRIGDKLDYTGIKIASNKGWVDKNTCVFSVKEGAEVTDTTDEHITITHEEFNKTDSTSFEIFICGKDYDKRAERIEIASYPVKMEYKKGDKLNFTGLSVLCYYSDKTTKDVTNLLKFNVNEGSVVDSSTPRKITATYSEELSGEFSVEFNLDIKILNRLEVNTRQMRKKYAVGDKLSYSGIKAQCHYWGSGGFIDVTDKLVFSPEKNSIVTKDMSTTATVTYTEGAESISIQIEGLSIAKVERLIAANIPQGTYYYGDKLDFSAVQIICLYWNGASEDVPNTSVSFSPSDGSEVTASTPVLVTVSYLDGTTTFPITISKRTAEE